MVGADRAAGRIDRQDLWRQMNLLQDPQRRRRATTGVVVARLLLVVLCSCSSAASREEGHRAGSKAAPTESAAAPGIRVGQVAADFTLPDDAGRPVRLSEHRGRSAVLLAFYPKDFTGG